MAIPQRPLGATGAKVSALGLGGYHLGKIKSIGEAVRLTHAAIDGGITFLDNAWEYHDGRWAAPSPIAAIASSS